jgi:hypothetical protein
MEPLVRGAVVESFVRPCRDGGTFEGKLFVREPGRYLFRVSRDDLSYTVECAGPSTADLEAVSALLPEPHAGNTHTCLFLVALRSGPSGRPDAVVRVASGDALEFRGRPGAPAVVGARPEARSLYWLSDFGGAAPIEVYAHDLQFVGKVFDDGFDNQREAKRAGAIRSLWIEDASDEMSTNRSLFKLLLREARDPDALPRDMKVGDHEAFRELRDNPVHDPRGPIRRIDVSSTEAANFDYVTQPDPVVRAAMREALLDLAIKDLLSVPTISFADEGLSAFARFVRSRGEYLTDWAGLPRAYAPPEGISADNVLTFGEISLGDGLPVWQEIYVNAEDATSSRFHVPTSAGMRVVGSWDAAAAVLYLDAQLSGDPRVSAEPVSGFNYDALAANGSYHGWSWTSFSFPDEGAFYIRIRTVASGFRSEFGGDTVHPTLEEALRASYEALTAPLRDAIPSPSP